MMYNVFSLVYLTRGSRTPPRWPQVSPPRCSLRRRAAASAALPRCSAAAAPPRRRADVPLGFGAAEDARAHTEVIPQMMSGR